MGEPHTELKPLCLIYLHALKEISMLNLRQKNKTKYKLTAIPLQQKLFPLLTVLQIIGVFQGAVARLSLPPCTNELLQHFLSEIFALKLFHCAPGCYN